MILLLIVVLLLMLLLELIQKLLSSRLRQSLLIESLEGDIVVVFENIFDGETGAYDEDWENYSRETSK